MKDKVEVVVGLLVLVAVVVVARFPRRRKSEIQSMFEDEKQQRRYTRG